MKAFRIGALVAALATMGGSGTITTHQEIGAQYGYGTKIDGLALTSARWTGWIQTNRIDDVAFDIVFTDANSSVSSVTMRCETTRDGTVANDAGSNLCSRATAAGTSTYTCPHTFSLATPGTLSWQWTQTDVNAPYINCLFTGNGTPAAADVITVFARGVSP